MAALKENIWNIKFVPHSVKNREMVDFLLEQEFNPLPWIPRKYKTDAVCVQLLRRKVIRLSDIHINHRTFRMCEAAMEVDVDSFPSVPANLVDYKIAKAAILHNPRYIERLDNRYEWVGEMRELAPSLDGLVLEVFAHRKRTPELCRIAVEQNPMALKFVPHHLRTAKMCIDAVSRDPVALQYVPYDMITPAMAKEAVSKVGWMLYYVPRHLKTYRLCWTALKVDISVIEDAIPRELQTVKFFRDVVRYNPDAVNHMYDKMLCKVMAMPVEMKEEIIAVTGDVAYYFRHCLSDSELKEQDLTREDLDKDAFKDPDFKFGRYVVW